MPSSVSVSVFRVSSVEASVFSSVPSVEPSAFSVVPSAEVSVFSVLPSSVAAGISSLLLLSVLLSVLS